MPKTRSSGTSASVIDECANLIEDYRNGPGAAKNNLRRKLESIMEKAAEEAHAVADIRDKTDIVELDVEKRQYAQSVRELAAENAQYFGTFAGLFSSDDYVHPSSHDLSLKCIETLFAYLMVRNVCQSNGDELIYRCWLGILTTT